MTFSWIISSRVGSWSYCFVGFVSPFKSLINSIQINPSLFLLTAVESTYHLLQPVPIAWRGAPEKNEQIVSVVVVAVEDSMIDSRWAESTPRGTRDGNHLLFAMEKQKTIRWDTTMSWVEVQEMVYVKRWQRLWIGWAVCNVWKEVDGLMSFVVSTSGFGQVMRRRWVVVRSLVEYSLYRCLLFEELLGDFKSTRH